MDTEDIPEAVIAVSTLHIKTHAVWLPEPIAACISVPALQVRWL